jgi:hypothetical protein
MGSDVARGGQRQDDFRLRLGAANRLNATIAFVGVLLPLGAVEPVEVAP